MSLFRLLPIAISAGALTVATSLSVSPALADEVSPAAETLAQVGDAVAGQGLPEGAIDVPGVGVSPDAGEPAVLSAPAGELEMGVPATSDGVETDRGVVFDRPRRDSAVVVQGTGDGGLRALISIDSPAAPERYAFPISGDVASLSMEATGGVVALDAAGVEIAHAPALWAVDANGTQVPTHFESAGTTLYQVGEHRGGNFTYGITADPWWNPFSWNWSGIITWENLKKCGLGALGASGGVMGANGVVNILKASTGKYLVQIYGGPYGLVGIAAASCLSAALT
jgi:hypothetical protein